MDPKLTSDDVIEALVEAVGRPGSTERDRALIREALRGLVRLALAEQLLRMQQDFEQAVDPRMLARPPGSAGAMRRI